MSYHRMAVRSRLHHVAIWTAALPLLATATTFNLSSDISAFIPDCATACFESFLEANFASTLCGTSPSLQCLCSKTGASGFTIGEGAVQCIVAENNIGACTGMDAGSQIVANAYGMCIGQTSAAPLTHSTIIATLIVPTGTGPVLVPSPASTSKVSTSVVTTSKTVYTTPSITVSPSISPSFVFATSTTSAPASTSSAAASQSGTESKGLSKGQIAGIAAGGAAAVLLAIVAIYILRCTYRKNLQYPDEKSSFSKLRDSWSPRRKSGQSPWIPQISAPRYHEPQSMDYSRPFPNPYPVRPETIGLAVSSENGAAVPEPQRSSRIMSWFPAFPMPSKQLPQLPQQQQLQAQQPQAPLPPPVFALPPAKPDSPPKPSLTLTIPKEEEQGLGANRLPDQGPSTQGLAVQRMPFNGGRDSIVTEFAEDGETDTQSNIGTQIWRPPSSDPQSATTYYVADKWGNWILSNPNRRSQIAELEAPIPLARTLTGRPQPATGSSTTGGPAQPAQAAIIARPPQVRLVPPERSETTTRSRSSSVYSNYSLPHSIAPGPDNPLPSRLPEPESYYKLMRDGSTNTSRAPRRKSERRERSDTMISHDSVTTIASSASGAMDGADDFSAFPEPPPPQQGSLSPVVESPHSGGTSPVTYPKIPRPRSGSNKAGPGLRLFPPGVKYEYTPAGQPSPTLGLANLVNTSPSDVRLPPSQQGLPSQQQQQQQHYPGPRRPGLNPFPNRNPGQVRNGSPNMPQDENNNDMPQPLTLGGGGGRWPLPPGQQQQQQKQRQNPQQAANEDNLFMPASLPDQHSVTSPATSMNSNASSLLAKRLGAERAAALMMAEGGNGKKPPPGSKWKRQQTPGTPGFLVDGDHVPLPATPGWQPKLTPTRRGDDLFLSVQ